MNSIRIRIAVWIIQQGVNLMPEHFRKEQFVINLMKTNKIKIRRSL